MSTIPVPACDLQNFLTISLAPLQGNCSPSLLSTDVVKVLWRAYAPLSQCDIELNYLLTRQQLLFLLMGCAAQEVDTSLRFSEETKGNRVRGYLDGWRQSQNTGHSVSYADSIGQRRYADLSTSEQSSAQDSRTWTRSNSRSDGRMDDTGLGRGHVTADSNTVSTGNSEATTRSDSEGVATSNGDTHGCSYTFNQSRRGASAGTVVLASFGRTASRSSVDRWERRTSHSVSDSESTSDSEQHAFSVNTTDGQSIRSSGSFFNANVNAYDRATAISKSESHGQGSLDSEAHAEGEGTSVSNAKSSGNSAGQSTALSHQESERISESNSSGYTTADTIAKNQRFQHLKDLYDNVTDLIAWKRKVLKRGYHSYFGDLLICHTDGNCPVPAHSEPCGCGGCSGFSDRYTGVSHEYGYAR